MVGIRRASQVDVELDGGLFAQGLDQAEVAIR